MFNYLIKKNTDKTVDNKRIKLDLEYLSHNSLANKSLSADMAKNDIIILIRKYKLEIIFK